MSSHHVVPYVGVELGSVLSSSKLKRRRSVVLVQWLDEFNSPPVVELRFAQSGEATPALDARRFFLPFLSVSLYAYLPVPPAAAAAADG